MSVDSNMQNTVLMLLNLILTKNYVDKNAVNEDE